CSSAADLPHLAPEQQRAELLRELAQRLEVAQAGGAALDVAGPKGRRDELLEQGRLTVGGGAERAQVAGIDAVPGELRADARDVGVGLGVALLGARATPAEQAELVELARELGRDPGPAAQLVEVDLLDPVADAARAPTLALGRARRRELVADHPQRQE